MADSGAQDGKWVTIKGHKVFLEEGKEADSLDDWFAAKAILTQLRKDNGYMEELEQAELDAKDHFSSAVDLLDAEYKVGLHYVHSGESFGLNSALRNDTYLQSGTMSKQVKALDRVMRPLPYDVELFRAVDADLGWFSQVRVGSEITDKAFMSTSVFEDANVFKKQRDVYMHIKVPKGHKAYVTNNYAEGEVVLSRGTKYKVNSITGDNATYDKYKIILDCEVIDD